jgi:hypothetical protein
MNRYVVFFPSGRYTVVTATSYDVIDSIIYFRKSDGYRTAAWFYKENIAGIGDDETACETGEKK